MDPYGDLYYEGDEQDLRAVLDEHFPREALAAAREAAEAARGLTARQRRRARRQAGDDSEWRAADASLASSMIKVLGCNS